MEIINFIIDALEAIVETVVEVIVGIVDFATDVVNWFKNQVLQKGHDIPFIANAKDPAFKNLLKDAPVKNVGIFEGIYNEDTEEINGKVLMADGYDAKTAEVLGKEKLVVLN